ncbi:MAG TPA: hypothetical protein VMC86_05980 [Gemmatimonadales bacterium]|nr:hypothetical protein [Gemmatimonadales bacterium]
MNLVPWFPEIAVAAGALALAPGLWTLRRIPSRARAVHLAVPAALILAAAVVLDLLVSERTGAALALGGVTALLIAVLASTGLSAPTLGLASWGAALLGLGALFEIFGGAAGMDDGGWKLFAQLAAAFALGSALVTAVRPPDGPAPDAADAGIFGTTGAVVIASATPFVANRVDGAALPMLIAVAGVLPPLIALVARPSVKIGVGVGAAVVALVVAGAAAGLDPVALARDEGPTPPWAPLAAALTGIALGVGAALISDKRWALAVLVASLLPFHALGPYGTALGGAGVMAGVGPLHRPSVATTFLTAVALLAASHANSPLATPTHARGWIVAALGAMVVAALGVLGKGSRIALLRVVLLEWIVIAPFVGS